MKDPYELTVIRGVDDYNWTWSMSNGMYTIDVSEGCSSAYAAVKDAEAQAIRFGIVIGKPKDE